MITEIIHNQVGKHRVNNVGDNDATTTFKNKVSRCLTEPEHWTCTGSYISSDGRFLLICSCECHDKSNAGSDRMGSKPTDKPAADEDSVPGSVKR